MHRHFLRLTNPPEGYTAIIKHGSYSVPPVLEWSKGGQLNTICSLVADECKIDFEEISGQKVEDQIWEIFENPLA